MKRSKYNAKKTTVDGITFDSKREAERYQELKLMEETDFISFLVLQPKFLIQEGYRDSAGKWVRPIEYVADFQYYDDLEDRQVVEDVKGVKTAVYRLKKKLVEKKYGIEITEVK